MSTARLQALARWTLVVTAFAISGCVNPFKPSDPPPPTGSAPVEDYSTPEKVLATMAAAMTAKSVGSNAWLDALADSSAAVPAPHAFTAFHAQSVIDKWQASNPGVTVPYPWDRTLETTFFSTFIGLQPTFDYTLVWDVDNTSPSSIEDDGNGGALLYKHYLVIATSKDGNTQITIAIGYVDLYFYKANGRWFLYRWQDRLDPTDGSGATPADASNRVSMGRRRLDSRSAG